MKKQLLSLVLLLGSVFYLAKAMEPSLKGMPIEIKLAIFNRLLEENSIIPIIKNLHKVRRVDKEFYSIVSQENRFKPLVALTGIIKRNNIFTVLDFIKNNPVLLRYSDLGNYLQTKFIYLSAEEIQSYLGDLLNPGTRIFPDLHQLINAVRNNDVLQAWHLLAFGLDVKKNLDSIAHSRFGMMPPLLTAINNNNVEMIKLLLAYGVSSVNLNTDYASTPLIAAITNDRIEILRLLLQNAADPNLESKGYHFKTPLMVAVEEGKLNLAELLLAYKADPNQEFEGIPLIIVAAQYQDIRMIQLLLKYGADARPKFLEKKISMNKNLTKDGKEFLITVVIKFLKNTVEYYKDFLNPKFK